MHSTSFTIDDILGKEKSKIDGEKPKRERTPLGLTPRRPILLPRVETATPLTGRLYSFPHPTPDCTLCDERLTSRGPWSHYGQPFANPGRRGLV